MTLDIKRIAWILAGALFLGAIAGNAYSIYLDHAAAAYAIWVSP